MYYLLFQHTTETHMGSNFTHFVNVKADVQESCVFFTALILYGIIDICYPLTSVKLVVTSITNETLIQSLCRDISSDFKVPSFLGE